MTIAWFDGGAGASGDMMLGALASTKLSIPPLQATIRDGYNESVSSSLLC
jgi:uncharacterized protein (DUF111 family)